MNQIVIGYILVICAGFLQGTFGLFLKPTKPFKWENAWLIYSITGIFIIPLLIATALTPNIAQVLTSLSPSVIFLPMLFGALWGVGSILFGLSLRRIGISLTYTIILGMTTLIGTSLPLFINKTVPHGLALLLLAFGLLCIILGIAISGFSGFLREKGITKNSKGIFLGLLFAIISGLFSPMLNIGFVKGKDIVLVAQHTGATAIASTFIVWVVILFAGFLINAFYTLYLLMKNRSMVLFKKSSKKFIAFSSLAGLFWFGSLALFGISSINIGSLGSSVGWGMFIAFSIVISNVWGIKFGEWKNSKAALKYQLISIFIILIGVGLIASSIFYNS